MNDLRTIDMLALATTLLFFFSTIVAGEDNANLFKNYNQYVDNGQNFLKSNLRYVSEHWYDTNLIWGKNEMYLTWSKRIGEPNTKIKSVLIKQITYYLGVNQTELDEILANGTSVSIPSIAFKRPNPTIAVGSYTFQPVLNAFQETSVGANDNPYFSFLDNGENSTMPMTNYESQDNGDNDHDGSEVWFGDAEVSYTNIDEAAAILGITVEELTPEKFDVAYMNAWIRSNEPTKPTSTNVRSNV